MLRSGYNEEKKKLEQEARSRASSTHSRRNSQGGAAIAPATGLDDTDDANTPLLTANLNMIVGTEALKAR